MRAFQGIHETRTYGLRLEKSQKPTLISCLLACMAGPYEASNNVVATLHKIEYANHKEWCSPSSTETAYQWHQSTNKDIEPKRITELFVRKSLMTKQEDTCETNRDKTQMKHLLEFDPRNESHKEFCQKHCKSFLEKFKEINQGAVSFKSFETDAADPTEIGFMDENIQEICHNTISDNPNATESELTTNTKHHDIYTKVNTITQSQGAFKSKTTPLAEKILFQEKPSVTNAAKWGIYHEPDALKYFYTEHIVKHQEFKTEKRGLYISKDHSHIVASPDGFISCKFHGL